MDDMDDIVREFLVESREGLDQLDRDLVALEQDPGNRDLLARIFRCIHTIKGTCGFLGFSRLESVSHVGENLLVLLRDGARAVTPRRATGLLQLVDAVREILGRIEQTGSDGDEEYAGLVATLTALHDDDPAGPPPPPVVAELPRPATTATIAAVDTTVRVDVALLDRLMNLVGELVLTRNQIVQHPVVEQDGPLATTCQRLRAITSELQDGVMKTRMQPIGTVWNKLPRVVRDLAVSCGKQVRVEMEGEDTELDRTIIEAIKDPLTHIIRNSIDHGIETPAARLAKGKAAEGRILMRAFHESGQVNIEVIDDGAGIDPARIKAKAVQLRLITPEQARRLGDREAIRLIFAPAFTTAAAVTNVSGRGVGMDVVRTNIERIGGAVDVTSVVGEGATLQIRIPLTLAIVPALVVTLGRERYAIPQLCLLELVRVAAADVAAAIETIDGTPFYRLRGLLLPLVQLSHTLALTAGRWEPPPSGPVNIVVLQAEGATFGLVVDDVNDTQEIVVKPLGRHLKAIPVFAGATIMGDGQVALILDVYGIGQQAGVVGATTRSLVDEPAGDVACRLGGPRPLLLFGVGEGHRYAIPLSAVARLEEFPSSAVEWADGREVVQYHGGILPLGRVADAVGCSDETRDGDLAVVVYDDGTGPIGLVVGEVVDIVEEPATVPSVPTGRMVLRSCVINGRVTDILDVAAVVAALGVPAAAGAIHG